MATESQITPGDELPIEPENEQPSGVEQSLMDQLRARRTAIASEVEKEFDLPGYDGLLRATYKRLGYEELVRTVRRAAQARGSNEIRAELNAQMDFLIRACLSIDANDGTHISDGYTPELGEFFQLTTDRAREIIMHVFANELAIASHQSAVVQWMQAGESDIAEDFQGE